MQIPAICLTMKYFQVIDELVLSDHDNVDIIDQQHGEEVMSAEDIADSSKISGKFFD